MPWAVILADFGSFFADFGKLELFLPFMCSYPGCYRQIRFALEGTTKSAVTAEATLLSQLLGREGTMNINSLVIKINEVIDTQIIDIGIVCRAQTGEILTKIETVGTDGFCKL